MSLPARADDFEIALRLAVLVIVAVGIVLLIGFGCEAAWKATRPGSPQSVQT